MTCYMPSVLRHQDDQMLVLTCTDICHITMSSVCTCSTCKHVVINKGKFVRSVISAAVTIYIYYTTPDLRKKPFSDFSLRSNQIGYYTIIIK